MREAEALAVLVSAVSYGKREQALREAGSALNLLADPYAYAHVLGHEGVSAIRRALSVSDRLIERLQASGTHLLARGEAGYPRLLKEISNAPHLLFCMGNPSLEDPIPFSIVGTRGASAYGLRHTRRIAADLATAGVCIVSGMALGIDAAAHWGALDAGGRTVAVLGSALNKPYPAENRTLMKRIIESGGSVVSEYPPDTAPTKYSFIQRNRIVAGMSLGVLVSDAPYKSGAQSTVQMALDMGREVFALPGDIDRLGSQLPNKLIEEGAHMVCGASDILSKVVIEPDKRKKQKAAKAEQITMQMKAPTRELDQSERAVYDLLLAGDLDFDAIAERTGIGSDELGGVLMMLELDGIVESLPGLVYRLV